MHCPAVVACLARQQAFKPGIHCLVSVFKVNFCRAQVSDNHQQVANVRRFVAVYNAVLHICQQQTFRGVGNVDALGAPVCNFAKPAKCLVRRATVKQCFCRHHRTVAVGIGKVVLVGNFHCLRCAFHNMPVVEAIANAQFERRHKAIGHKFVTCRRPHAVGVSGRVLRVPLHYLCQAEKVAVFGIGKHFVVNLTSDRGSHVFVGMRRGNEAIVQTVRRTQKVAFGKQRTVLLKHFSLRPLGKQHGKYCLFAKAAVLKHQGKQRVGLAAFRIHYLYKAFGTF